MVKGAEIRTFQIKMKCSSPDCNLFFILSSSPDPAQLQRLAEIIEDKSYGRYGNRN